MSASAMTFETERSPWWLHLMGGILNVIIGLLLLTSPAKTAVALAIALGLFWLIHGVFILVAMFVDHSAWGWKLLIGLLSILAGMVVLRHPLAGAITISSVILLMMGIQGLIFGVVSLMLAFKGGGLGAGALGVLSVVFGLILILNFASPAMIVSLVWAAAVFLIAGGIVQVFQAYQQRA